MPGEPSTPGRVASDPVGDVVFRPLRAGNALEDTVARLMQTIRLGAVAPGGALPPERELAARFTVSRDTVREAIRELADAGYLVSRRGRYGGTFVVDELPVPDAAAAPRLARGELEDVLGLRETLETGAARAAAGRALGADEREALWTRYEETRDAAPQEYRRLDSRLHLSIAELAGIPSLVPLIADSRARNAELLDAFPLLPRAIDHSDAQHEAIVVAILAGRPDRAAAAMREHLAGSALLLRGFLG
ncbi:FadR/GntR family transcriptional regulator [Homoserinibacter sp. YIM 151385]|uniref:FadR/GntR family transcriptional regulator n=1 Tax=Homoserinibacter sp. YIM 151385 TaxID=2985506 RepID=UPI0022F00B1B|nr:GntR family transcriptional regulator [Homoserinibacter sp. YIM 151385]WBU37839.1 GntR family transcriptional regulator [Homoserinibacter sp. YIM 151385]